MMADIIDFRERRTASLLAHIGKLASDIRASQQAEAQLLGIDPSAIDDNDDCDLEEALEHRRDDIASMLGMRSASSLRMIAMMLRGDGDMTVEEEQAIRYFRTWIIGEAA